MSRLQKLKKWCDENDIPENLMELENGVWVSFGVTDKETRAYRAAKPTDTWFGIHFFENGDSDESFKTEYFTDYEDFISVVNQLKEYAK